MARSKPDIDKHEKALRESLRKKLYELRKIYAGGYSPCVLHLHADDVRRTMEDLKGAGFDVARGVVFKGIPVKAYRAH